MKLIIEMCEGEDYESKNLKENIIKKAFEKKIRFLLKLRESDKIIIKLRKGVKTKDK